MSEKELLNAILKRFPRIAEEVKQKPRVARKVVRLALREPRTVAESDETTATILSDLQRAVENVPPLWRVLLFTGDKRSPRVRAALKRIKKVLGEGV
jgi:hypothetical protein